MSDIREYDRGMRRDDRAVDDEEEAAIDALARAVVGNVESDAAGRRAYCMGCRQELDGAAALEDLRDAGWDVVRRAAR